MLEVKYTAFYGQKAVVDANVIIDLHEIGALSLLHRVFSKVCISEEVASVELKTVDLRDFPHVLVSITTGEGYRWYRDLGHYASLSRYDRLLFAIAAERELLCVTNEGPLRRICEMTRLAFTGTLGILGCACEIGLISSDELSLLVDKLEQSSCFLSSDVLARFREEFGLLECSG